MKESVQMHAYLLETKVSYEKKLFNLSVLDHIRRWKIHFSTKITILLIALNTIIIPIPKSEIEIDIKKKKKTSKKCTSI